MKKTRINLLSSKQDYYKIEGYFGLFRTLLLLYSVVLFVVIGGLGIFLVIQSFQLRSVQDQKKAVLRNLSNYKTDEVKLIRLSKKLNAYHTFMQDDARFIPYYELLVATLQESSQSATLKDFTIDKSRALQFKLAFNTFDEMSRSFQFIESNDFKQNFESLDLIDFIGKGASDNNGSRYELSFKGVFKKIHE